MKYQKEKYSKFRDFYQSLAWKRLRLFKLNQQPWCERCEENGYLKAADEVHHIVELEEDESKALEITNLESLCKSCHSRETANNNWKNKKWNQKITYKTLNKKWNTDTKK